MRPVSKAMLGHVGMERSCVPTDFVAIFPYPQRNLPPGH